MIAFNRLAGFYEDLDQYQRQAQALSDLGANFPNNPYDSWYRLGEGVRASTQGSGTRERGLREGPPELAALS